MVAKRSPTPAAAKTAAPARKQRASVPTVNGRTRVARTYGYAVRSAFFDGTTAMFSAARTFFEAASHALRLVKAVDAGPNSANGEIERVRMRSRWTYANDPFYRQACRQVANNVVHHGIKPVIKDKALLKLWKRWAKEADVRGKMDFYGIEWAIANTVPRDGEAIVRFRQRKPGDMRSGVNFQLQLMEADHLPLEKTELAANGHRITSGVELDAIERVVAYWLHDFHPKDQWTGSDSGLPKRVPAEEVMHIFMADRFTGTRGYPWGASALNTSESLRTYEIAELERKKGQANFLGVLKKPRLAMEDNGEVAGAEDEAEVETPTMQPMEPNSIIVTPDDYDFSLEQPTTTDSNYAAYRRENLSGIAVAMGLAVEHVTLNFDKLGDRQYRAVMLEVQRYLESLQYHMMVFQFCEPVWRRFVSEVVLNDLWKVPEGVDIEDVMDVEWMCPARGHIHPVQEIAAFAEAVKNGFTSRKRVTAEFGWDVEDIDAENETDQKRASEKGLAYAVYPKLTGDAPAVSPLEEPSLFQRALDDEMADDGGKGTDTQL